MRINTVYVKHEFHTTDEQGNQMMDSMSKEETLQKMQELSEQYGENAIVEFSGNGLEALSQSVKDQIQKGYGELTEERKAERAQKQELLNQHIVQLENTHRVVIPNIQTNAKLYDSLENASEQVVKAANGIIQNYFLPHDVSGMTEQQRLDTIALGMEEAKYLAANYLEGQCAEDFLSAMETIAQYGMNGVVSEDGKVIYHIEKGPLVGAPDDYVSQNEILKKKAPELYAQLQELNQSIAKGETGWGKKFIELQKQVNQVLNADSGMGRTNYEEAVKEYKEWKNTVENTKLPDTCVNVVYTDMEGFFQSLQKQGALSAEQLLEMQQRFTKWLAEE